MGLIDEVLHFILTGSVGALPSVVLVAIPVVIGLVAGLFLHKFLKAALVVLIVVVLAAYLGLYSADLTTIFQAGMSIGSMAYQYAILLFGVIPLTGGFVVGAVIGFILS